MGEPSQRPTMAEAHKLLKHLQESPFELDEFDEKWNQFLPKSESAAEKIHGSPNFPMKIDNDDGQVLDDTEDAVLGGPRLSFTQGFEIDNKTGFKADDEGSNKMIVNPSFEEENDDIAQFIDEASSPNVSKDVVVDLYAELDKDIAKFDMNEIVIDIHVDDEAQKVSDMAAVPISDTTTVPISGANPKRDSFRNSVHMMVSTSPSEDHVEFDVLDIENSRAESFMTADSTVSTSPDKFQSTGDFLTPVGSVDTESQLREIERSEEYIVGPGRGRVSSGSESEHDVLSTLRPMVSPDDSDQSGSASERVSQFLMDIQPPPYSPNKSPGLENDHFDFDKGQSSDSSSEDGADSETVVMRQKHGTAANPLQRSGVVESDADTPESGFMNLKNIDANAHVHVKDPEKLLDVDENEEGERRELLLTGSDGKTYIRKSSIKQSDQMVSVHGKCLAIW
jgi:hypothetical protein